MNILNRRRQMGKVDEVIMTSTSNPEVMAICYAQGWAKHVDYMTLKEAQKVKNVGTIFKDTGIVSFNEFQYFTNVKSLYGDAFMGCTSLTEISLHSGITSIPSRCFYGDTKLLSINLENVTRLYSLCFYNCQKLNNVDTSNVTYMESAFRGCTSLTSVDMSSCPTLAGEVFRSCTSLTWIDVSDIVSITGSGLFYDSKVTGSFIFSSFTGTTIPESIFDSCSLVTDVQFPSSNYTSIGPRAFMSCGLQSFAVREGCTTLNNHSFSGVNWRYVDLPSTLTTWNGFALWNNRNQKAIVCRATTPPTVGNTTGSQRSFDSVPATCKIYVPQVSISLYEAAAGWDRFAGRYLPIEGSWYETHRSLCPYDAEIEYLESETGVWLDTGIVPDFSTTVEIKGILYTEGSYLAAANTGSGYYVLMNRDVTYCRWILGSNIGSLYPGLYNKEITILFNEYQTHKAYINGVEKETFPSGNVVNTQTTLALFAANGLGTNHYTGKVRINYCKIQVDGVLVRDFIPVRVGQVGYMYDKISNQLFANTGEGNFILGQDIVPIEYLECTGTQWINSNIQVSSNLSCQVTYITDAQHNQFGNPIIGSSSGSSKNYHVTLYNNKYFYGTGTSERSSGSSNYNVKHTIKYNISNGILNVDGNITDSYTSITSNEGYIYFGYRTANNIYSINLKYYEIIIFDKNSNSILCHLVPVRIGQVGYMRDKISGKLYGNSGTGDFVLGPDKT